jgi:hypothetical protein
VFRRCVVKRLPAAGTVEMREGNTRSDPECPGTEDGRLAQEPELPEYLERSLLENVVGEGGADKTSDVAAQGRIGITQKLFQCGPVPALREKDKERLLGGRGLLRLSSGLHA